jgi:hypothetical protein
MASLNNLNVSQKGTLFVCVLSIGLHTLLLGSLTLSIFVENVYQTWQTVQHCTCSVRSIT